MILENLNKIVQKNKFDISTLALKIKVKNFINKNIVKVVRKKYNSQNIMKEH